MLARSDHDFVLSGPKTRRKAVQRKPSRTLVVLRALFRNPGRTIVGAAGTALSLAIVVNALMMQGGPHPAPFFKPPVEIWRPTNAPVPPARPSDLIARELAAAPISDPALFAPVPSAGPVRPARGVAAQANITQSAPVGTPASVPLPLPRDPIADVLKTAAAPLAPEPSRMVFSAQMALAKLNYAVKPDGLLGTGTRQAIERFERDHKLAVTGELGPRTLRELSAASGLPVE
jgi:hypothetical protein